MNSLSPCFLMERRTTETGQWFDCWSREKSRMRELWHRVEDARGQSFPLKPGGLQSRAAFIFRTTNQEKAKWVTQMTWTFQKYSSSVKPGSHIYVLFQWCWNMGWTIQTITVSKKPAGKFEERGQRAIRLRLLERFTLKLK